MPCCSPGLKAVRRNRTGQQRQPARREADFLRAKTETPAASICGGEGEGEKRKWAGPRGRDWTLRLTSDAVCDLLPPNAF